MRLMHFSAETITDALAKVRQELGEEASIVSIRRLKHGGIAGREVIEVSALPASRENSTAGAGVLRAEGLSRRRSQKANFEVKAAENGIGRGRAAPAERDVLEALKAERGPLEREASRGGSPVWDDPDGLSGRLAFVGPAGVGKTTMAAKLAHAASRKARLRVGLIASDYCGFRGTAVLEVCARAMGCDFGVAFSSEELSSLMQELGRACDLLIVDTPGVNVRRPRELARLESLLAQEAGLEKHLIIPATASRAAMEEWILGFGPLGLDAVAVSRVDEAEGLGMLRRVAERNGVPLSFIGSGRRVTGEIESSGGMLDLESEPGEENIERQDHQVA